MAKKVAKPKKVANKTTKADAEYFQEEFLRWVIRFGLQDWELMFIHKTVDSEARVDSYYKDKVAHITLSIDWADHTVTKCSLRECARHEAVHLALATLDHLANDRYATKDQLDMAIEDAVRRICTGIGSIVEEEDEK